MKDIWADVVFLNTSHGTPTRDNGEKTDPCKDPPTFFCFGAYFRLEESHFGMDFHIKRAEDISSNAELVRTPEVTMSAHPTSGSELWRSLSHFGGLSKFPTKSKNQLILFLCFTTAGAHQTCFSSQRFLFMTLRTEQR